MARITMKMNTSGENVMGKHTVKKQKGCYKPASDLISFTQGSVVVVRVGRKHSSEDCLIHANLLRQNSPFFQGALAHGWKEKRENMIRLPQDDIATFDTYCAWLYHRTPFSHSTSSGLLRDQKRLRRAWMFGHKILDYDFCDMVIDALIEYMTAVDFWPYKTAFKVYQLSSKDAPVRRLLTDIFLYAVGPEWFDHGAPELSEEVYQEITLALLTKGSELTLDDAPW